MPKRISYYLLVLSTFLMPFYIFRFDLGPLKTNIFEIAVFCALLSTFYFLLSTRTRLSLGSIYPYLILLTAFISIFWSIDMVKAAGTFKGWFLVPFIYYLLAINLLDERAKVMTVIRALSLSALVVGLWVILQRLGIIGPLFYQVGDANFDQYLRSSTFRAVGPFESPNFLAMFLAPVFFLVAIGFTLGKRLEKFWLGAISLVILVALALSMSKTGIVAFLLVLGLVVVLYLASQKIKLKPTVFLPAIAGILALTFAIGYRFVDAPRREIYGYAVELLQRSPIYGLGLGSFQWWIDKISIQNQPFQLYALPYALHPHNLYLAIFINLGIFGFIAFVLNIAWFFWRLLSQKGIIPLLISASIMVILVHGLFDTTYFKNDLSAIFWLILALGVIFSRGDLALTAKTDR